MLFDTHAHLDSPRFEGEVEGVLERAYASWRIPYPDLRL